MAEAEPIWSIERVSPVCLALPLGRNWRHWLGELVREADEEFVVAAPYISMEGVNFVLSHLEEPVKRRINLTLITDLSPMPICQGSTDPSAVRSFVEEVPSSRLYHLPKLHAKIYVSGTKKAIVTSGNLTSNGLYNNYEYGILLSDPSAVEGVRRDLADYAILGSLLGRGALNAYCDAAVKVRQLFKEQFSGTSERLREEFRAAYRAAEDDLIGLRLSRGAMHTVFEDAILLFLERNGPLTTPEIHGFVEESFPDLCDNAVDRVINGVRFGKRWKHAVRTAQQHLKKKGLLELGQGKWRIKGHDG